MADDQDQGSGTDQQDDADQTDQDDAGQQDDVVDGDDSSEGTDEGKETVTKAEFNRLFARMQAADKAKSAAEAKLQAKERAELSDLEKAKAEAEDNKKRADEAEDRLETMLLENAFHRENKYSWHDVGDAIASLDMSSVEIDSDGKVTGMTAAIKDVAKRKPHYVKTKQENDDGEGTDPPAANGASNGRRKGAGTVPDSKTLVSRFPALGK